MNLRFSKCVCESCVCVFVCVGSVQASDKIKAQPMLKSHSFRTPHPPSQSTWVFLIAT